MDAPREDAFDVIVIGGGPVGENAASRTADAGLRTVLVEAELYGGECSYWACMPSKALLRPLEAVDAARHVPGGSTAVSGRIDVAAVLHSRDEFTSHWDDLSQVSWVHDQGVEVLRGRGRLAGERRVEVTTEEGIRRLTARHAVVIATGSVPSEPPIEGLGDTPHWGSRDATSAQSVPDSLVIVGGGVVGAEMAQAFSGLGSTVTMIADGGLLNRAEPFAGEMVMASLVAQGVTIRSSSRAVQVARDQDGVTVTLDDGSTVAAAELLVATGRRPATDDLGVDTVGMKAGQPLEVDDRGRVTGGGGDGDGDWLYAVGDVNGRAPLTHQGKYQARIAGSVIVATARGELPTMRPWSAYTLTADHAAVPQVVFTQPQVAWVGRTAREAEQQGVTTRVVDLDIAVAGSALHRENYEGKARFVVDEDRMVLVGVTFVGPDVAELLHSATVAVVGEVPLDRLWHAVPSYPTISEVWLRFLEQYGL